MRAIVISGGLLAIAGVFGLGVVVGRFVLTRDVPVVAAPTNALPGVAGLDNPLGDPTAASSTDPSMSALPPAPAAPLPPALPPGTLPAPSPTTPATAVTAQEASKAAMEASRVTAACNIRVSRDAPIRSWTQKDRLTIVAIGETCGTATVRISFETPTGAALYSLQTPARDFGITPQSTADEVRDRITQALPTDAVRAAAYPVWSANAVSPPSRTEFSRDAYEAVRAADNPVTCVRLPNMAQRCLANDPTNGQIKVFSRG
jgi:hypothetical protein